LPHVSVKRIVDWGADAVKILIYYTPFDDPKVNDIKHAFIERIGAECEFYQIPFFLEFVGYDPKGGDEKGLEFAKIKPKVVIGAMEEFSKPQYHVDVLKVEVPINAEFVEGQLVYKGQKRIRAPKRWSIIARAAAVAATKPFIYLSAGVGNAQFVEALNMATEAGTDYSGVLCGRATWKDGMPIYATKGVKGAGRLAEHGRREEYQRRKRRAQGRQAVGEAAGRRGLIHRPPHFNFWPSTSKNI
jgi:tagatose 1,6-diphosphate aldolase